jgi:predicted solute-binding protein
MALRDQGMSWDEIRIVSTTTDRELVRRHLELHVERLEERLGDQRRTVAAVERVLAEATEPQVESAGRAS